MSIMCPDIEKRRGFAIVSALFIVVALAALGTFIAIVSSTQHAGNALDLAGARVRLAAQAGIEWGAASAYKAAGCLPSHTLASTDNGVTVAVTVNGMTVTVGCTVVASGDETEAGLGKIYRIVATACNFPDATGACPGAAGPNYVERRLEALVEALVEK